MRKQLYPVALVLGCTFGWSHQAQANAYYDAVQHKLNHQAQRIENGIDSGSLVSEEQQTLYRQHNKIVNLTDRFIRDGYISQKEHHILSKLLTRANADIARLKNNRVAAFSLNPQQAVYRDDAQDVPDDFSPEVCNTTPNRQQRRTRHAGRYRDDTDAIDVRYQPDLSGSALSDYSW